MVLCAVAYAIVGYDVVWQAAKNKTMRLVKENVCFTLGVKVLMLALGGCGIVGMWGAVFADVGVALVVICNALRALISKKIKKINNLNNLLKNIYMPYNQRCVDILNFQKN